MTIISRRTAAANGAFDTVKDFYFYSRYGERRTDPGIADFTFGNPHEMPLGGIVAAIREAAVPQNQDWFAYKTSEEAPQAFLARAVGRELVLPFDPPDIALTAGAFAAIAVAFRLPCTSPGTGPLRARNCSLPRVPVRVQTTLWKMAAISEGNTPVRGLHEAAPP